MSNYDQLRYELEVRKIVLDALRSTGKPTIKEDENYTKLKLAIVTLLRLQGYFVDLQFQSQALCDVAKELVREYQKPAR